MNTTLIIIAFICIVIGIAGSILPGLPGPPISWAGLLIGSFAVECPPAILIITAVIAALITLLDYILPSRGTKKHGGSKAGIWGCNIGLVISIFGLPFGPQGLLGLVFWPFAGALVGELIHNHDFEPALKAAWGAFTGFVSGTLLKVVYCIALLVIELVLVF